MGHPGRSSRGERGRAGEYHPSGAGRSPVAKGPSDIRAWSRSARAAAAQAARVGRRESRRRTEAPAQEIRVGEEAPKSAAPRAVAPRKTKRAPARARAKRSASAALVRGTRPSRSAPHAADAPSGRKRSSGPSPERGRGTSFSPLLPSPPRRRPGPARPHPGGRRIRSESRIRAALAGGSTPPARLTARVAALGDATSRGREVLASARPAKENRGDTLSVLGGPAEGRRARRGQARRLAPLRWAAGEALSLLVPTSPGECYALARDAARSAGQGPGPPRST